VIGGPPRIGPDDPPAEAGGRTPDAARELLWLNRRRDLLLRAISEMEYNVATPGIRLELVSNIPELLAWARGELARIEERIARIGGH
jgi:hypothetical protein